MINIFFLINQLRKSGPVQVLYDICKYLDRNVYCPHIITMMKEDKTRSIKNKFEDIDIKIYAFQYRFIQLELFPRLIAKNIEHVFLNKNNVIVHAHGYQSVLIASYIKIVPTVTTIHCIAKEDYVKGKGFFLGYYMTYRYNMLLKQIKYPVVISKQMSQYYSQLVNNRLIYNGVSSFPANANNDKEIYRKKINVYNEKGLLYVVSGYFSKRKNQSYIIQELKKSKNSFICIFIGEGEYLDICKKLAKDDNRFRFAGYVFNVSDYLNAADYLISASLSEGLPLAVLESLSYGKPVLLSNIPPHREIFELMNCEGLKVFDLQPTCLTRIIDNNGVISSEIETAIRYKAHKIFGAEVMSNNYQLLYQNIIKNH